jgi:hypothetical protein
MLQMVLVFVVFALSSAPIENAAASSSLLDHYRGYSSSPTTWLCNGNVVDEFSLYLSAGLLSVLEVAMSSVNNLLFVLPQQQTPSNHE